jgi:LacI family transcriptional regulator
MMLMKRNWRGPTIAALAKAAGVGTATVDRVLNGRDSVRPATRNKVLAALAELQDAESLPFDLTSTPAKTTPTVQRRIRFLCDSGSSFNRSLGETVGRVGVENDAVVCLFESVITSEVDPAQLAEAIERTPDEADGLVVVAREDPLINRALRSVAERHVPIICLTTDLPNSGRTAYIGNDQTSAGATAAYLMGRFVGARSGKILIVVSAPFRSQEEREVGFRRVLRSDFSHLDIEDRVNSNDEISHSFENVSKFIKEQGPPAGIYNVAGGNAGIGKALEAFDLIGKTVFIGHELNPNSRRLLDFGQMDIFIGHDIAEEVALSIDCVLALLDGRPLPDIAPTQIQVFTKFNVRPYVLDLARRSGGSPYTGGD